MYQNPELSLTGPETDKLLRLFMASFPSLQNEDNDPAYLVELFAVNTGKVLKIGSVWLIVSAQ